MKILVVGSGGREHALAWKLAGDSSRPELFLAPGNAGTAALGTNLDLAAADLDGLVAWARVHRPDLVVVGPEVPLCAGLTDRLQAEGILVFGPNQAAARLEGSKIFAKEVMLAAGVPTAHAEVFERADEALRYVRSHGVPVVIKADGLAAGKGVTVCTRLEEAEAAIREALVDHTFGAAGNRVLIEDCLSGPEASILGLVDGERVVLLASSQDHKRVFDGDRGPNTGGMGAYSPAPVVGDDLWPFIRDAVFGRTLTELRKRGITYRGILYAGLMLDPRGPQVLEFNCRFGDPETQAVLPRWEGDLLPALRACAQGALREDHVRWKKAASACVVMAAGGYPGAYATGDEITGLAEAAALPGVQVFHAGTRLDSGRVVTGGGRVLGVTALGPTLQDSLTLAYRAAALIHFRNAHYRKDIGWRALS